MNDHAYLPPWAAAALDRMPSAGGGVHLWLASASHALTRCGASPSLTFDLLKQRASTCGRSVPDSEIRATVQNIRSRMEREGRMPMGRAFGMEAVSWWPLNVGKRRAIESCGFGEAQLREASPENPEQWGAESLIDVLFPNNPLLCLGKDNHAVATRRREVWRGRVGSLPLIVPNPMASLYGHTKEGQKSQRSFSNVGERRFLVLDFDTGTADSHAAILWFLSQKRPLRLVLHSGGKSLHGWFYVEHVPEVASLAFMQEAVSLGADRVLWVKHQLVRIPGGTRQDGSPQRLLYFNPRAA
jgi:hypothetical protein